MSLYFALLTVENNENKKSVKFQGDILNFGDFIYVFVFTTNHHLKCCADQLVCGNITSQHRIILIHVLLNLFSLMQNTNA